jgi:hypothetical protein
MMIKKIVVVGMIMGVLSSCVEYRIKRVTHSDGSSYHFPQQRRGLGDWVDVSPTGSYTYDWAVEVIREKKERKGGEISYLKIK